MYRQVEVSEFISRLEGECKARDSRVQRLQCEPAQRNDGTLQVEVGVVIRGEEVRLPIQVSPEHMNRNDPEGLVSSILMTVDRYSWGLT